MICRTRGLKHFFCSMAELQLKLWVMFIVMSCDYQLGTDWRHYHPLLPIHPGFEKPRNLYVHLVLYGIQSHWNFLFRSLIILTGYPNFCYMADNSQQSLVLWIANQFYVSHLENVPQLCAFNKSTTRKENYKNSWEINYLGYAKNMARQCVVIP